MSTKPPTFQRKLKRNAPQPMRLEPRLMFDGAAVDTVIAAEQVATEAGHYSTATVQVTEPVDLLGVAAAPVGTLGRQEIVFIDTGLADWQTLAEGVRDGVDVILIDPDRDGFEQITQALSGREDIAAIHIVSHGSEAMVRLGSSQLDDASLLSQQLTLAEWGTHLAQGADILIYGCDVAANENGQSILERLGQSTGADVAASTDPTGGVALGGDWKLEYSTGSIEAAAFLTSQAADAWQARLATINLSGNTGWTAIMYGAGRDPQGDSQAGAADTDIIADATHGSLYTAYDDNGTATTADDFVVYRLRIDNPTSPTNFGGVAVVGMDANQDGRVDLFLSVDGRNNGQAVKLLDPGTGANISPNTTTTSPCPPAGCPTTVSILLRPAIIRW